VPKDVYEEAFQKRGPQALAAAGMAADGMDLAQVAGDEDEDDDAAWEARIEALKKLQDAEKAAAAAAAGEASA
jgi:hypothetical protein